MKFDRIDPAALTDNDALPPVPAHADAVLFTPHNPPRWLAAALMSGLIVYPLLGWAIYALVW